MPTLAEILKSANIADEVISGLPPEVVSAVTGYVSEADTKYQTAAQKEIEAAEIRRLAELEKADTQKYVEDYGNLLTDRASLEAQNTTMKTYLKSLKDQGYDVPIPVDGGAAKPVVPGSPAIGANATGFDPDKFKNQVGTVMGTMFDVNNEHIRLFGSPIPDSAEALFAEAARARKSPTEFIAEKYKFAEARQKKAAAESQKEKDAYANQKLEEYRRAEAEKNGGNPNLRSGVASTNSVVTKIKHDDFQKASGNLPKRERLGRMLDKIHGDVAAAQTA